MGLNKKMVCGLAAALCSLFLLCSRSDVITGVGSNVVTGMDSTLTDMAGGFRQVHLGSGCVDLAYSLPSAPDPAFSTQTASVIYIGISRHGDTLAAHMQYQVTAFPKGTPSYVPGDTAKSRPKAFLYFRADDTLGVSDSISVFQSDTLAGLRPVSRDDKVILITPPPTDDEDGDQLGGAATDNRIGRFALRSRTDVDSMPLPDDIARKIFDVRTGISKDTVSAFAFSIVDYFGDIRRIRNPYVIVHVTRAVGGAEVRDSIPSFTRFTAFENAAMAPERADNPFSSHLTLRTAVFKINIGKIIDELGAAPHELINAVISVKADTVNKFGADIDGSFDNDAEALSGNYRIVVLDTLLTNNLPPDSVAASLNMGLRNQFGLVGVSAPTSPYSVHEIKTPVRNALRKAGGTASAAYIYVYLRASADYGTITWAVPLSVETAFTPSRSQ